MVGAPARREVVRWMCGRGLPERQAVKVIGMSASSLRYRPALDRNVDLRNAIVALAHRHRRYGAGMITTAFRRACEAAGVTNFRFHDLPAAYVRVSARAKKAWISIACNGGSAVETDA